MLGTDLRQQRLHTILRPHRLARNHLLTRHEAFGVAAKIDVHAVSIDALHQAGEQLTFASGELLDDLLALCFPNFLNDDLLGRLRGDAAELDRLHRFLDVATRLRIRIDIDGIDHAQLAVRDLQFG